MRIDGDLVSLFGEDLSLLEKNPEKFWEGIHTITDSCFHESEIETIKLVNTLKLLRPRAFSNCTKLRTVEIPTSIDVIHRFTFENCTSLETVILHEGLTKIGQWAFAYCDNLKSITIPSSIEVLDECFIGCENLEFISIPYKKEIHVTKLITNKIRYCYINEKENRVYFTKYLLENDKNISEVFDLNVLRSAFYLFDDYVIEFIHDSNKNKIIEASKILNKIGLKLPYNLVVNMIDSGKFEDFIQNSHFNFFKKEIAPYLNGNKFEYDLYHMSSEQLENLFSLIIMLGCFSKEKLLDSSGKETNVYMYQKASSLFIEMIKKDFTSPYTSILANISSLDLKTNQKLLEFLAFKQGKDDYPNLDLIQSLYENNISFNFASFIRDFDKVLSYRTYLANGKPKKRTWKEAIQKYLIGKRYVGVTGDNEDIASEFDSKDLEQKHFDLAVKIREEAKERHVPAHVLGKPIKEETILESIQRIKSETERSLCESQELIDELYDKQFTFEFLDKYDPKNFVLGAYCSCCATITSMFYGATIAEASVSSPDIQNLVVRDSKGDIVAKSTLYINRELGYVVLNDFEINEQYKTEECIGRNGLRISGYYEDDDMDTSDNKARQLIFKAFMRGIKAFIKEYDRQNPDKPLQQVNVGLGYNRLKSICTRFHWTDDVLVVPKDYSFHDAAEMQCVLYKHDEIVYNTLMEK